MPQKKGNPRVGVIEKPRRVLDGINGESKSVEREARLGNRPRSSRENFISNVKTLEIKAPLPFRHEASK